MTNPSAFRSCSWKILFSLILLLTVSDQIALSKERVTLPQFKTFQHLPYDTTVNIGKHFKSLDLYAPASGKNHPIVIWVHGGAWKIGDKRGVDNKPQAFTQHGYLLVSINYRLHPEPLMINRHRISHRRSTGFVSTPKTMEGIRMKYFSWGIRQAPIWSR